MEEKKKDVLPSEEDLDEELGFEDFEDEDVEEDEEAEEEEASEDAEKSKAKEEQDKAERARQAKLRREREAKERAEREKKLQEEAYLKGQLDGVKVNTFTNEPITDEYDLKIYKVQLALEKEGKDPISDLPKRLAELDRTASNEAKKKEAEKREREDAIDKDIADFRAKYPNVSVAKLLNDPDFKDYSDGRLGIKDGKSLAQLYEDFTKFKAKYVKEEVEEAETKSPPSPNGGRKRDKTSYSTMTEEQKIAELKKQGLI